MKWNKLPVLCDENWCLFCSGLNSDLWLSEICDSTYFESVLNVKVPTMTSNTQPSGEIIYSREWTQTYIALEAFNGTGAHGWLPSSNESTATTDYIGYKFISPVRVNKLKIKMHRLSKFSIECSNDKESWITIKTIENPSANDEFQLLEYSLNNNEYYLYYRVRLLSWTFPNAHIYLLQFYGRSQN